MLAQGLDPLSPEAVQAYFSELLWTKDDGGRWRQLDNVDVGDTSMGIMEAIADSAPGLNFRFADIAQAFQMIEDTMVPIIIPADAHATAGAPMKLLQSLEFAPTIGGIARQLQRHIVQIPRAARFQLLQADAARRIKPDVYGDQFVVLNSKDLYTEAAGLDWSDPTYRKAADLMM